MRIDAHQHFWNIANRQGRWPPPALAPIYRDFAPSDLLPALRRRRIDGTVLVHAADCDEWFTMARRLCEAQPGVRPDDLDAMSGGNAHRFYRLHLSPYRQGIPC